MRPSPPPPTRTISSIRWETKLLCGAGWRVETYNKQSLHSKYRSQGVQTWFYESTPTTHTPWEINPTHCQRKLRECESNIPDAPKHWNNRGASKFSMILHKRIPGRESIRRLSSYVHNKFSLSTVRKGDYTFKIDLEDAYFHLLIHPDSRKYL